jgi:hypothetical protein
VNNLTDICQESSVALRTPTKRISRIARYGFLILANIMWAVPSWAAVPGLVQHVAGAMDNQFVTTLALRLPSGAGAGNCLILGVRFNGAGSIASVVDDKGNAWQAGPSVLNNSFSPTTRASLYFATSVASGTQKITITFSGLAGPGGSLGFPQAVISEFYNVALASALDGSASSANTRTTGSITPTTAGDLVYHWGVDVSATDPNYGIQFNGSSITAGTGFTLLGADLQTGSADQYFVQPAAAAITPTFSASGSHTWASVAMALKSCTCGTPPPNTIRIVHVQHTMIAWPGHSNPVTMQFPTSGNLLVGLFTGTVSFVGGISDSAGNTWQSAGRSPGDTNIAFTSAEIVYAANAATSPTLGTINTTLSPACSSGDCNFVLYDVANAAASTFDKATTASGDQQSFGNVTMASLTPATPNELVFHVASIDFHTINGAVGAGYVLDSMVNAVDDNESTSIGGTSPSRLDMDNAFGHYASPDTSVVRFVYTAANRTGTGGIRGWGAVAAAFKGSPNGAPSAPTGLIIKP